MANWTQSISDSLASFGPMPSTLWNAMTWGTDAWGYGRNKMLEDIGSNYASDSVTPSDTSGYFFTPNSFNNSSTFSASSDNASEVLGDGSGYSYVFPLPTTNRVSSVANTYTSASGGSSTYTSAAAASSTWTVSVP